MPTFLDMVLFTGAVYGLSWLVTRSKLAAPMRRVLQPVPFVGHLMQCIVCTSAWVAMALAALLPLSTLFSPSFRVRGPVDLAVLVGWTLMATWAMGSRLGDAD